MRVIGFSPAEVTELLEVTAVVLKLGNVQLSSSFQASGMEACSITEPQGRDGDRDGNGGRGDSLSTSLSLAPLSPHTELQEICKLIGLDPSTLEQALCSRTVKARDETVLTTLTVPQVSRTTPSHGADARHAPHEPAPAPLPSPQGYYGRDALAKNIYSRLFDWVVNRINTSIQVSSRGSWSPSRTLDPHPTQGSTPRCLPR